MMPVYIPVVVLLVAGFLTPLIGIKLKIFRRILVSSSLLFSFLFFVFLSPSIFPNEIIVQNVSSWLPPIGINLVLDSLSLIFLLLITGIGFLASLVVEKYVHERRSEFYSLFLLMIVGMMGIVLTGDLFNLYVFYEIMCISSYGLIVFYRTKKSAEAAIKYLLISALGSSLILLGIALTYGLTGTLNLADIITKLPENSAIPFSLIFVGFAIKAGLVPFHIWLPDAHSEAPIPVSVMLSGVLVKMGLYVLLRLYVLFDINYLSVMLILGLASIIVGDLMALQQKDIKRMLAYSTISQVGYISFALGLGSVGFVAGTFHLINHVLIKSMLFLIAGSIVLKVKTRDMTKMKGLGTSMPVEAIGFLIGAFAISGIPPLNGFASKFMIYMATLNSGYSFLVFIPIIFSVVTLGYYLRAFFTIFGGAGKKKEKIDWALALPVLVLASLCVVIGLFPQLITQNLQLVINSLLDKANYYCAVLGC